MAKIDIFDFPRRKFIASASSLFLGMTFFPLSGTAGQETDVSQQVPETFSSEDLDRIKKSKMAGDLMNYFHLGYSCAESVFMVSLRFLRKPEELVWSAAGFGGGMYHKNLCGFLTGGIMSIGIFAGTLKKKREDAKEDCSRLVKQYWEWWTARRPLLCADIRTEGSSSSVCENIGKLSAAKLEEMFLSR